MAMPAKDWILATARYLHTAVSRTYGVQPSGCGIKGTCSRSMRQQQHQVEGIAMPLNQIHAKTSLM